MSMVLLSEPLLCPHLLGEPAPALVYTENEGSPLQLSPLWGFPHMLSLLGPLFLVPLSKTMGLPQGSSHLLCLAVLPSWGPTQGKLVGTKREKNGIPHSWAYSAPLSGRLSEA